MRSLIFFLTFIFLTKEVLTTINVFQNSINLTKLCFGLIFCDVKSFLLMSFLRSSRTVLISLFTLLTLDSILVIFSSSRVLVLSNNFCNISCIFFSSIILFKRYPRLLFISIVQLISRSFGTNFYCIRSSIFVRHIFVSYCHHV